MVSRPQPQQNTGELDFFSALCSFVRRNQAELESLFGGEIRGQRTNRKPLIYMEKNTTPLLCRN
jgi:hypothetical protein